MSFRVPRIDPLWRPHLFERILYLADEILPADEHEDSLIKVLLLSQQHGVVDT